MSAHLSSETLSPAAATIGNVLAWGWGKEGGNSQFSKDVRSPSGAAGETEDETCRHPQPPGSPSARAAGVEKQMKVSWQNHLTACQGLPMTMTDDNRSFWGAVRQNNVCLAGVN